jgi:hypothetical protein
MLDLTTDIIMSVMGTMKLQGRHLLTDRKEYISALT